MNKKILLSLFILSFSFCALAQDVKLQFISVNGYGNNLYIDNVSIGTQFNLDVAVTGIQNIAPDTSYAIGSSPFVIIPMVSVLNAGRNNIATSFNVTMAVTPGGYQSTKQIASLNKGQSVVVSFDNLTITPGQAIDINITSSLAGDENPNNNTLAQQSLILPGVQRNVLLEEWTSSTCGPCAANNPTIDAFVTARFDSLVAIKYHVGWPSPGNDPMYLYNPTQSYDRRYYYGVNAVPHVIMDGVVNPDYPYSSPPSLPNAYYPRKEVGSPLSITVTNTHLPGDTIQADITVNVLSPLKYGQYYMRVHAIERHIHYNSAPGSNGETDFYDVFRRAYPNSLGTQIPLTAGTYNYTIKYPLDMVVWVDSMIYTAVFIQDDLTKEVINCAKSRDYTRPYDFVTNNESITIEKPISSGEVILQNKETIIANNPEFLSSFFYTELFDGAFPSAGWTLVNPDGGITFEQYIGANGPSFGGTKSARINFYSYSTSGQTDTLISRTFTGLNDADSVKFDYAYAQYPNYSDRLIVRVSVDGGITYPHTIFDKSGAALATAPSTTGSFVPTANQWATFAYSLFGIVIPVELSAFTVEANGLDVQLMWSTASETNNYGFEVQKKSDGEYYAVAFVNGHGTTTEIQNYSFVDKDVIPGNYTYRLKQVDLNGAYSYSDEVEVDVTGPKVYSLEQNFPNPFNPSTKIAFNLAANSNVIVKIFNLLGEEVSTLVSEKLQAGRHELEFNASNLNSGIYFYRIDASGDNGTQFSSVKKMMLVK